MGCTVFKPRPMTYREIARLWQSNGDAYPFTRSDDAFLDQVIPAGAGPVIICGGDVAPTCPCGHLSDLLCDWPIGDGKTCDLPLCPDCSHHVGEGPMKPSKATPVKWRRALARARWLAVCADKYTWVPADHDPNAFWFWRDCWYMDLEFTAEEALLIAASLALDGMPTRAQRTRGRR